ncbi:MAG: hypothetical protein OEY44_00570 [Candidatus Peregrinibacteria bacterium]|nr:hypothetical protein [Candidatus Peregrinibacteria bacterium]
MKTITRLLLVGLLVTSLIPAGLATEASPIRIQSLTVETVNSIARGEVYVCNTSGSTMRFVLEAKNLDMNRLYRRRLQMNAGSCQGFDLKFADDFAQITQAGDSIRVVAKKMRAERSSGKFDLSDPVVTEVEEADRHPSNCGDEEDGDRIYTPCAGDFVNHEPSGLRVKVKSVNRDYAEVLVAHIRWGGVKRFRVRKNSGKLVVAGNTGHSRVEINNLLGENRSDFFLQLKTR